MAKLTEEQLANVLEISNKTIFQLQKIGDITIQLRTAEANVAALSKHREKLLADYDAMDSSAREYQAELSKEYGEFSKIDFNSGEIII